MAMSDKKSEPAASGGSLYRTLVSTKTSLVFLAIFAILFFIGTVFPQSSEPDRLEGYSKAGGKFASLVGALDLLNLFHSWYFTLFAALFALHLVLCCIHRLNMLRRRPRFRQFLREELLQREHSFSVSCSSDGAVMDIEKTLRRFGFRHLRHYSEDAYVKRVVSEKGLPFRWLSWTYHVCILLAIGGFCITYLLAFEGEVTLPVGQRKPVPLNPDVTKWSTLAKLFGRGTDAKPRNVEVELDKFTPEYVQWPSLEYPEKPTKRWAATWKSRGRMTPKYKLDADSIFPRDWFSTLKVYEDGNLVREKTIQVNDPLRYAGLTFYQAGYEYEFDVRIGGENLKSIPAGEPFTIPEMEGEFRLETPRIGTLFRYDGKVEILSPSARLQYRPPTGAAPGRWQTVTSLPLGRPVKAMHAEMTLTNLKESSVLSYRYDPSVPLLWLVTSAIMLLMALRIYVPWYQVWCHADSSTGRTIVTVSIRMVGLFARPERIKQKLCDVLCK